MKVAAVDLFCGAGGLSYGLQQAGISVMAGIDRSPDCKYPYEQNIDGEYIRADIHALAQDPEPIAQMYPWDADIKVLTACAPCQPYSTMGHSKEKGREDHQKWGLLNEVSRIVEYVNPDVVVTENVLQVKQEDGVYDSFVENLESQGYHINSDQNKNVYCPQYGIPQKRKRWVLMASKIGPLSLSDPPIQDEENYPTVKEAIDHLPPIEAGEVRNKNDAHRARSLSEKNLERIDNMVPGGDWTLWEDDLDHLLADCHRKASGRSYKAPYSRMRPDEPSPTITTQFYNYGSGRFGHYDTDQNRALSLREGALLQTFPEDYDFYNSWEDTGVSNLGRQIGNAVPPKLGEYIGQAILSHVGVAAPSVEPMVADD
ncbi:DNA (cytosine-5-)-methyltransferase [Halosegnis longus]|uniref:DNA (cytosine-5-)-methyltransferase n=1 Tax=Halosegnis longus TaxID=2216012 RepID=UPI00096AB9B4|nr:DNA cytosine methyltransferase [Salella cibi]